MINETNLIYGQQTDVSLNMWNMFFKKLPQYRRMAFGQNDQHSQKLGPGPTRKKHIHTYII